MPNGAQPSGWRKATAGLAMAERHATAGERASVPKSRAFTAVKRVGPQIGLKPGDLLLLDTLGAFTQVQDWEEGRRAIVWASNAYLMERTGFSLSALKRHARRLTEAGVIAFRDSPNGKRWGHRDAAGVIVEAYGFDLSPLAARAEEFERLHAELRAERANCQRLKRQITVTRRMLRARIDAALSKALTGPWAQLSDRFQDLLSRIPRRDTSADTLEHLLTALRELQDRVETAFQHATTAVENAGQTIEETPETAPSEAISDPHIQTTIQLDLVICNSIERENIAGTDSKKVSQDSKETTRKERSERTLTSDTIPDFPVVIEACPEFSTWGRNIGGTLKNWSDLHRIAGQLGPMIGLSQRMWDTAQDRLGTTRASAALALIFEKHCAGELVSPNGYLRGMLRKAGAGALHLDRSFYGRLNRPAA